MKTARIERGHCPWAISRRVYSEGDRSTPIYDASQIRDPNLIDRGHVFVPPEKVPPEAGPGDGRGRGWRTDHDAFIGGRSRPRHHSYETANRRAPS